MCADHAEIAHPALIAGRPPLRPEVVTLAPGLHSIFGVSLANCHVIEAPQGLIVVDAGHGADEGAALRGIIRTRISKAPILALLYTHHHYTRGAATLLDGDPAKIVAHPRLAGHLIGGASHGLASRLILETGRDLPDHGPDAVVSPAPRWPRSDAALAPDHCVLVGERLHLGGTEVVVLPGCFDTDDGLAFHLKAFDAVAHNLVTAQFPNFGSLGGGPFRDPLPWMAAIEAVLAVAPGHLLPCHGRPLSGRERCCNRLQVNLMAVSHLVAAIDAAIDAGASLPDLIRDIRLPPQLAAHPDLGEIYGTVAHAVIGIAQARLGVWSGEVRDLLPLHPDDEARGLADLLGGANGVFTNARQAAASGRHAWALHLADAAVRLGQPEARILRGDLLRSAAQRSTAWTERNTMLSLARKDQAPAARNQLYSAEQPSGPR